MSDAVPDQELMVAYRAGSEQAATALFERYYARLIELIRRKTGWRLKQAEGSTDVAQSALRSFFSQIRNDHVQVTDDDTLWPLLVAITLNKVRNRGKFWQRGKRDPGKQQPLAEGLDPLEQGPTPEDAAVLQELIDQLLAPFSDRRRRTVELLLEGLPVHEIAVQVGTTQRTIYNTRLAAAQILEQLLASD